MDVTVTVAAAGATWESGLLAAVESSEGVRLVRRCADAADLLAVARTAVATLALVSLDLPGLDLGVVDDLERAGVRVVAVDDQPDPAAAAAIGIRDVATPAEALLERQPVDLPAVPSKQARLWAVCGALGAPGASTVALSLAVSAARSGQSVALVDADGWDGSLSQQLAVLDEVSGLMAACRAATRGRPEQIDEHLVEVESHLRLMSGMPRREAWDHFRPVAFERVLGRVRQIADLVVVDCGRPDDDRRSVRTATVDAADEVVLVGAADPLGVRRLVRTLSESAASCVVVNKFRTTLGWRELEVESVLAQLGGRAPDRFLPWDLDAFDRAAMHGIAVHDAAPRSPFVTRIDALATHLQTGTGW